MRKVELTKFERITKSRIFNKGAMGRGSFDQIMQVKFGQNQGLANVDEVGSKRVIMDSLFKLYYRVKFFLGYAAKQLFLLRNSYVIMIYTNTTIP